MKFQQYAPVMNVRVRTNIINAEGTPYAEDGQTVALAYAEEMYTSNRRPFYRVYPGVAMAMLRLGIEKIDISHVNLPVNGLALEFAEGHFLHAGHLEIVNLLVVEFDKEVLFIEFVHADGKHGHFMFSRKNPSILDWLSTIPQVERSLTTQIMQIVFGVCMIPVEDSDLIKPLVLNKDKEKFESTGDMKYVERARRRGINGWEVGRDIPTPEEMEAIRQQGGEPGRKSPHWRTGYFAIRHTGEGRSVPVIRWIRETFVNKDIWKEVPTGYHGSSETADDT
jgi:hypothetical protein